MSYRKVFLITGACGFVGTNLILYLLKEGWRVIAADRESLKIDLQGYRCVDVGDEIPEDWGVIFARGDVRDASFMRGLFSIKNVPVHFVAHLAAVSTIQAAAVCREEAMDINIGGTETVLTSAREYGKLVGFFYSSTDKVYGEGSRTAYAEEHPLHPHRFPL